MQPRAASLELMSHGKQGAVKIASLFDALRRWLVASSANEGSDKRKGDLVRTEGANL